MKFTNDELGCSFEANDKPTVRQQLAYRWAQGRASGWEDYWTASKPLITNWQCKGMASIDDDIETLTAPSIASSIMWACAQVLTHMNAIEEVDPN